MATSRVAYPEVLAAFTRRRRESVLTRAALARAVTALDRDLEHVAVVELSVRVAGFAGELAERRSLRGCDAIHLASAIELERLTGAPGASLWR